MGHTDKYEQCNMTVCAQLQPFRSMKSQISQRGFYYYFRFTVIDSGLICT